MYCWFYVVLCIVCVYMCTVLLPPGGSSTVATAKPKGSKSVKQVSI